MKHRSLPGIAALFTVMLANRMTAQAHDSMAPARETLGTVHFATSCNPAVAPQFDRAVTLLHSFEFGAAIRGFSDVLASDPTCAMAEWGIALSRWTNPMAAGLRSPALLESGRLAANEAKRLGSTATVRERGYIDAVGKLYDNYEHTTQRERIVAYEQAMSDVALKNLSDTEATIFYALALVAAAPPSDKTYANQLRAGAILEEQWAKQPNHPGLAHYIIHAYDVPALARQAQRAAERYADMAPSAAHALHMPSHTFTRIGMWQESVKTNLRSIGAAETESAFGEMLHASDYAVYAYLQMRQDSAAKKILDGLPSIAARLDPTAITGAASGAAGIFALAAIPARYAIERREWKEAAALTATTTAYPYTEAMTWFARALGGAHVGDLGRVRSSIQEMTAIKDRLTAAGETYWAEQVGIQAVEARAAMDFAEGRLDAALVGMRDAVRREEATEKSAVTPGPLAPAHELLGDMFMDMKRPADALVEYRQSLTREPNRYRTLSGALKAATATGDRAQRAELSAQLDRLIATRADTVAIAEIARDLSSDAMRGRGPWTRENELVARRLAADLARLGGRPLLGGSILVPFVVPSHALDTVYNVVAVLPGRDGTASGDFVGITAHLDHLGVGVPDVTGDSIYNGFLDDAISIGMILDLARRWVQAPGDRPLAIMFFNLEEQGLLGSTALAARPDARALTDRLRLLIGVDAGSPAGEALEWQVMGALPANAAGRLADSLARVRGWSTTATPVRPISDVFPFAEHGVPVIFPIPGKTWKGYSDTQRAQSMTTFDHYHNPKDEWRADFPMLGTLKYADWLWAIVRGASDSRYRSR